jgi:hypothetical protein
MELMAQSARAIDVLAGGAFTGVAFASPLRMDVSKSRRIMVRAELHTRTGEVIIRSSSTHVKGQMSRIDGAQTPSASAPLCPERHLTGAAEPLEPLATSYAYSKFKEAGLEYGPEFRLLRSIKVGRDSATGLLRQQAAQARAEFILNPAVLDCILQVGGLIKGSSSDSTMIPATLEGLTVAGAISAQQRGAGTGQEVGRLRRFLFGHLPRLDHAGIRKLDALRFGVVAVQDHIELRTSRPEGG